jgi:hypothetical protein
MYQSGSISTPGTCTQGKLVQYVSEFDADETIIPQQERVVTQCGTPSILTGLDGGLHLFVAGQADHPSSPSCAPWPLSPLCLHLRPETRSLDLTRLPDMVDGIKRFVSGIPSAVMNDRTMLAYFNGGQLLEYQRRSETVWSISAIPVPNIVVDANPVATLAGGSVFVLAAPRGEALLLCKRDLQMTTCVSSTSTPKHRSAASLAIQPLRSLEGNCTFLSVPLSRLDFPRCRIHSSYGIS